MQRRSVRDANHDLELMSSIALAFGRSSLVPVDAVHVLRVDPAFALNHKPQVAEVVFHHILDRLLEARVLCDEDEQIRGGEPEQLARCLGHLREAQGAPQAQNQFW